MDSKKIIWTIVLIVIIVLAGVLFYKQMKPFISRPAPAAGPEMPPPGAPPEAAQPAPPAEGAAPAPAEPAPAPAPSK